MEFKSMKKVKDEIVKLYTYIDGKRVDTGRTRHDEVFKKGNKYYHYEDGQLLGILDNPHGIDD